MFGYGRVPARAVVGEHRGDQAADPGARARLIAVIEPPPRRKRYRGIALRVDRTLRPE
jgi:hypothetical protein